MTTRSFLAFAKYRISITVAALKTNTKCVIWQVDINNGSQAKSGLDNDTHQEEIRWASSMGTSKCDANYKL